VTRASTSSTRYTIEFPTNVCPHPAPSPTPNHLLIISFKIQPLRQLDTMSRYSCVILTMVIFASLYLSFASYLPGDQRHPTDTELQYTRPHSLGHGYAFDPRDGWQTVNVSNLSYKYSPRSPNIRRARKIIPQHTSHKGNNLVNKFDIKGTVKNAINSITGKGKAISVTITW